MYHLLNRNFLFFLLLLLVEGVFAQVDSSSYPLQPIPLPAAANPMKELLPQSPFFSGGSSLLKVPDNKLSTQHKVNYETRKVDIVQSYFNPKTQDSAEVWRSHYPELALYTYDLNQMALRQLWLSTFIGVEGEGAASDDQVYDIDIPVQFPDWLKDFGLNKPKLEIDGDLTVSVSGGKRKQSNDQLNSDDWLIGTPNPDLDANLHVKGKVGPHLTIEIKTDENLGRDDFRITYKEAEEGEFENQILQEVEAGKTSLALPGTELTGYSEEHKGLFGIKAVMKFGDFWVTTIASQEGGSQESYKLNSRSEESEFFILDKDFIAYKYYFLNENDRKEHIKEQLGRGRASGLSKPNLRVYAEFTRGPDSTGAISNVTLLLPDGSIENRSAKVRELTPAKKPEDKGDYYYDSKTGVIHIRQGRKDGVYGYKLDGALQPGKTLQLFKHSSNTNKALSKLMLRNRYNVGVTEDNLSEFQLSMYRGDGNTPGNFLQTLGLADESGVLKRDDKDIFNTDTREMILPCPEFDSTVPESYKEDVCLEPLRHLDSSRSVLYDTPVSELKKVKSEFKFAGKSRKRNTTLKVSDSHSISSGGCFDISPGTEKLKIGSITLERGKDYEVMYEYGQIELISDRAKDPNAEIEVTYECEPLFSIDSKTLLGMRGEYKFESFGEGSLFGTTVLYKNQSTTEEHPGLGREPFSSFLWGANIRLVDQARWMRTFINFLPLIDTKELGTWRWEAEFARSWHNPNTKSSALLDDFESSKRELPYTLRRNAWSAASPPGGVEGEDVQTYNELLDYRHQGTFIWHSNFNRRFSEIYFPTENSEVDRIETPVLNFSLEVNDNQLGNSWGGVMRANSDFASDLSQFQYLEVVVFGDVGEVYIDFGRIAEDLSINGFAPNGRMNSEGDLISNTPLHDNGLDNQSGEDEVRLDWACREELCVSTERTNTGSNDPAFDDFKLQEDESSPSRAINGTEGNNSDGGDAYGGFDSEDLNRNGALDFENDFIRYKIDLNASSGFENLRYGWRRYSIPLGKFHEILSENNLDFEDLLRQNFFTRIWYGNLPKGVRKARIELAKVSVVGNRWEESDRSTEYDGSSQQDKQWVNTNGGFREVDYSTQPDVLDSNFINVRVINNRDDFGDYFPSPKTKIEKDQETNAPLREQSLVLSYGNLKPGQKVHATRFFDTEYKDLTQYENLEMEIHLDGIGEGVKENVRFAIQLGQGSLDGSENFYEWSFRPEAARCQERLDQILTDLSDQGKSLTAVQRGAERLQCHNENWNYNRFYIPLRDLWPLLKLERTSSQDTIWKVKPHPDSTYTQRFLTEDAFKRRIVRMQDSLAGAAAEDPENPNRTEAISVVGEPSLSRVNWIRFVILVDEEALPNEEIEGVFWINDLRLSGVRSGWGTAARTGVQLDFSQVMTISGDVNYRDGDFATLSSNGSSPLPSLAESKTSVKYQGNFKFSLDRFAPEPWKLKMPLDLGASNHIQRPYLKPNSDVSLTHDDYADVFSDIFRDSVDISPKQEFADRRPQGEGNVPLSRGFQTVTKNRNFGIGFSKEYVKDTTLWKDIVTQAFLERPALNYSYRSTEVHSSQRADSNYAYNTVFLYELGRLENSRDFFQPWPRTFEVTVADVNFVRNIHRDRDPNSFSDSLPIIKDYQVDLRHRVQIDWNLFPFLKMNYSLDLDRDMDEFKESFGYSKFFSGVHGGYLANDVLWAFDSTDYTYSIDSSSIVEIVQLDSGRADTLREYRVDPTRQYYGRQYGLMLNERKRSQTFKMNFNPKWVSFLDMRMSLASNFNHDKTLSSSFDPYDIGDLDENYWSMERKTTYEFRPVLKLQQLFAGSWGKSTREFLRKWGMRTITGSWSASVHTEGEDYTLPFLRDSMNVHPADWYLYSLGLGDGNGWRNPWNVISGDMGKEGPEDHRGFAEYFAPAGYKKVDSLVYQGQFVNTINRAANIGTKVTLPWYRIETSYDLGWRMEFQQPREYPLQLDTTITWPKYSIGATVPNFVRESKWLASKLKSISLNSKFTYEKDRHSRPHSSTEDAVNRKYGLTPFLGVNFTTKGNTTVSNNIDATYNRGWRYLSKYNPEGTITYTQKDILRDSVTAWVYQDLVKTEGYTVGNRLSIRYEIPTQKGFRIWSWYLRLENPIYLTFNFDVTHREEWREDFYANEGEPDTRRPHIIRNGMVSREELESLGIQPYAWEVEADPENPYEILNQTAYNFAVMGDYKFSDKIMADGSIRYDHIIDRGIGQNDESVTTQQLSYLFRVKFIF